MQYDFRSGTPKLSTGWIIYRIYFRHVCSKKKKSCFTQHAPKQPYNKLKQASEIQNPEAYCNPKFCCPLLILSMYSAKMLLLLNLGQGFTVQCMIPNGKPEPEYKPSVVLIRKYV